MRRAVLAVVVVLILLPVVVVLGAGAALNSEFGRARIVEAMQRATGHAARIDGSIGVAWSLTPAFTVTDIALLNAPGYSRPEFVSVRRGEAQVALLPLLRGRVEIPSMVLEQPDVLLERDANGRGNWLPPPAPASVPTTPSRARTPVELRQIRVADGRVAWAGLPPVLIQSLAVAPDGGPVAGTVVMNGVAFALQGETKPVAATGFPIELTAMGSGVALAASGQAGGAAGVAVAFQASAADLASLAPLLGRQLPALQNVVLTGQAGPGGLAGLKLVAGASDLGGGLRLVRLEASAAGLDQPVRVLAQAALRSLPVAVALDVGRVGAGPLPVQGVVSADGATLNLQGVASAAGLEGTVTARVPDLQRTGALAGVPLPGMHDVALDVRVLPAPVGSAGPPRGVLLRGLRMTSGQGDLAGDLALGFAPRPSLRGSLQSERLDLDAWTALPPAPTGPALATPLPAAPPAPAPAAEASHWLIPDRPLPFAALRRADADLRASIGQLTFKGATYHSAELRLLLQDGRLRLDPATVIAPGGPLLMVLQADAGAEPPKASLVLHGLALDAAALVDALGAPGAMTGAVDLDVDLRLSGATEHAMAATLDGHAAIALTDGDIANEALASLVGTALKGANIPFDVAGRSRVRCLAVRIDATAGKVAAETLTLDASRLRLEGGGQIDLGSETMDLHLRPELRLGSLPISVPVSLTGPWRSPRAQVEKGVVKPGRFGFTIGAASPDLCGPALAAVRQGLTK